MIAQDLTASSELAQFNPANNVLQPNDSVMNMSYANQMKLKGYAKKRNSVSTTKQPSKKKRFINVKKSASAARKQMQTTNGFGRNQLIGQAQLRGLSNDQGRMGNTKE